MASVIKMKWFYVVTAATALFSLVAVAQRTSDWGRCGCDWITWEAWSECSSQCYGTQIRTRKVWVYTIPSCSKGFEACDGGDGGREYQQCNKDCNHGTYNKNILFEGCSCHTGWNGKCCDQVVTCAIPSQVEQGTVYGGMSYRSYQYGDTITYSCDRDYNLTGLHSRTCASNGGWSGSKPRCQFAHSCRSNPCQNNGTCTNGLDTYSCKCRQGWSGRNCEVDVQPPVYDQCPTNKTVHTSEREINCTWEIPNITDPLGNMIRTSTNYPGNITVLPWGDHTVSYTAVKENNGLMTSCLFTISVRPKQCHHPLTPPLNGYIVCNDWRADYGRYCLLGCNANYSLPRSVDAKQWLVCGATGQWTGAIPPPRCYEKLSLSKNESEEDCKQNTTMTREGFISSLKSSPYRSVCLDHLDMCRAERVQILCAS